MDVYMQYCFTEIGGRETEIELAPDEIRCSIAQPGFLKTDFVYKYQELRLVSLDKPDPHFCNMKLQFRNGEEITIPNRSFNHESSNAIQKNFDYRSKEFADLYEGLQARLLEHDLQKNVELSIGSPIRFIGGIIYGVVGLAALIFTISYEMRFSVTGIIVLGLVVGYQVLGPTM